jgi:hypothetical protein
MKIISKDTLSQEYDDTSENPMNELIDDHPDILSNNLDEISNDSEKDGELYLKIFSSKLNKLRNSLNLFLKVNIGTIEYKMKMMKYNILSDIEKNYKNNFYKLKEVSNRLKKDINSKLIISKNTKDINRIIYLINCKIYLKKIWKQK